MPTTERAGGWSPRWRDPGEAQDGASYRRADTSRTVANERDADRRARILERLAAGAGVLIFAVTAIYLLTVYWQLVLFMALGAVGLGLVWWSRRPGEPAPITVEAHVTLPAIPAPPLAPSVKTERTVHASDDSASRAEAQEEAWQLTFQALAGTPCVDLSSAEGTGREDGLDVLCGVERQVALAQASSVVRGVVGRRDVVAVLRPEPSNRFDRNAVRVEVFGRLVGYLARDAAAVLGPILIDLQRSGYLVATEAEITGGVGRTPAESSLGILLLIRPHAEWAEAFADPQNVRGPEAVA